MHHLGNAGLLVFSTLFGLLDWVAADLVRKLYRCEPNRRAPPGAVHVKNGLLLAALIGVVMLWPAGTLFALAVFLTCLLAAHPA